jgi:PPOX class probable F420-dependent enzyme
LVAGTVLDLDTEFGARADRRLREEIIGWLVTVTADGTPQARPVWYLWDGETLLLYSLPAQAKVRNIERNPIVALHLDSANSGDDIVMVTGTAAIDPSAPAVDKNTAYLDKYLEQIVRIGFEGAAHMAEKYTTAIRILPSSIKGF